MNIDGEYVVLSAGRCLVLEAIEAPYVVEDTIDDSLREILTGSKGADVRP